MSYDILILGGGPAGLAAAVAAGGRGKSVLVVGNRWQDSPLARSERVDNYLGLPGLTGSELMDAFHRHARQMGAGFVEGKVLSLMAWEGFMLTVGSDVYQGRALILAPGVVRQVKFPGEEALLGRGLSYCATCDGMLYRGKPVAVVGLSPDAPQEANYLQSIGCQVTYISPKAPQGLDPAIHALRGSQISVLGDGAVSALEVDGRQVDCAGAFILRPAVAPTDLLPDLAVSGGYVAVDRRMATNLPGVFAAGDCTGLPLQIAKAVGEGHVAALSACAFLDEGG